MTEKRFTTDNGSNEDVCLVDNLTKKEYESNFNDIVDFMNKLWGQTQRFEKHNKDLMKENEMLKQKLKIYKNDGLETLKDLEKAYENNKKALCNIEQLHEENEELKKDIENLKITIKARETLIDVCEKKFNELGYIITVDDDGYVIE